MEIKTTVLILVVAFVATGGLSIDHRQGSAKHYQVSITKAPFMKAAAECNAQGGVLATINNKEENQQALDVIHAAKLSNIAPGVWFGGLTVGSGQPTDKVDGYYWLANGNKLFFANWVPGQPDLGGESCLHFWSDKDYGWNNIGCEENLYWLCEFPDKHCGIKACIY